MRCLILVSVLCLTSCAVWINEDEFGWEMGASANATRTIERREITLMDGTVIVDEGVKEETAENAGMGENTKDTLGLLRDAAKTVLGAP